MWLLLISILDITLQTISLMMMILVDNVEHYLFNGIILFYCESFMCSLGVKLTLLRTYCSPMCTAQLWWNYKTSTITELQIAYHNNTIFLMFLGMSKYESPSYLCTLFDIQCCQSVIRKLVYGFMCRLDSSVNYIIKDILATSLRYTCWIHKHWCSLLYIMVKSGIASIATNMSTHPAG